MTSVAVKRPTLALAWILPAALGAVVVHELVEFLQVFFAPTPLFGERWLLSVLVTVKLGQLLVGAPREAVDARALWLVLPAAGLALATPALISSQSAAAYAFLLLIAAVAWLVGGRAVGARAAPMLGGLALLVYAPRVVMEPMREALLRGTIAASAGISAVIFPDVQFQEHAVVVAGETIAIVAACGGMEFLMTLAACTLIVGAGRLRVGQLAAGVLQALSLGLVLNLARILLTIGLARAGFADLAWRWGHQLLGHLFILAGVLAVLWRVERARR